MLQTKCCEVGSYKFHTKYLLSDTLFQQISSVRSNSKFGFNVP